MAYTTIDKPDDYFNTVLYTGNGSTAIYYRSWFSTRLGLGKRKKFWLQSWII
jgi:hypothetical protein